jgi:small subunit ribosomal protein S9
MAETASATKKHYYRAVGRRKTAVAVVRLTAGKGIVTVNEKPAEEFFSKNNAFISTVKAPLELISKAGTVDITARVNGGGLRGQADAIRLGVARALVEMSEDFRVSLKKHGYLTRDPRKKERKKPGLKKARKAPQFSKR